MNEPRITRRDALLWCATAIFLVVAVARSVAGESAFRTDPVEADAWVDAPLSGPILNVDEPMRMIFAAGLWVGVLCFLLAVANTRGGGLFHRWLGLGVVVFLAGAVWSAIGAADPRAAWLTCFEQGSMVAAGYAAIHVFASRRRFVALLVTLASVGGLLAAKGLLERTVEIPDRIAFYYENGPPAAHAGDAVKEALFEQRVLDTTVTGYDGLANILGSTLLLVVAAMVGLAWAKASAAGRQPVNPEAKKGEIPVMTLAAVLAGGMAALGVAMIILTRSRGAIFAAGATGGACVLAWVWMRSGKRRLKPLSSRAMAWLLAGVVLVGAGGWMAGRMTTKTMAIRGQYFDGAVTLIAENPLTGVGGGNFGDAYLTVRQDGAEEAVKTPHNLLVHAPVQFGLAGWVYLAVLCGFVVLACRPRAQGSDLAPDAQGHGGRWGWLVALCATGVLAARWAVLGPDAIWVSVFVQAVLPALAFCVMGALMWMQAGRLDARAVGVMRVALTCGVCAFVLHNVVSFSLWTPGAATIFWLAAGACAGYARQLAATDKSAVAGRWARWLSLTVWLVFAGAMVSLGALPTMQRMGHLDAAMRAYRQGEMADAYALASQAAMADPWDGYSQMTLTKVLATADPELAREQLKVLTEHHGRRAMSYRLASDVYVEMGPTYWPAAFDMAERASQLDPANMRLHLHCAALAARTNQPDRARHHAKRVLEIDAALDAFNPMSLHRLTDEERRTAEEMLHIE
jgi:hypothetical protein